MPVQVTDTYLVYRYEELTPEQQEKAHEKYLNTDTYYWGNDDNAAVLKEFENLFPVKVTDYEYGYRNYVSFRMTCEDEVAELKGARLWKYLVNHDYLTTVNKYTKKVVNILSGECELTGYCIDEDILDPLREFMKRPPATLGFEQLMRDCLNSWLKACRDDYEGTLTMEYFKDACDANDWTFRADGTMDNTPGLEVSNDNASAATA